MDVITIMQSQLGFFLLIFTRVTGILTTAPILGSRNIPVYTKAGFALILSYILTPIVVQRSHIIVPDQFGAYVFLVIGELLIGLILGYISSMIFYAVQMAGQLLDMQIGFGIVNIIDPQSGQQLPLIGNFKYIFSLLVFFATNGHHILLSALFTSFKTVPVGAAVFRPQLADLVIDITFSVLIIALKISLPILVAIFLTDIAMGILARIMPQMNIFIVGIPGKIIVGIFMLALTLPFYITLLEVGFSAMYKDIYRLLLTFS
ncbi:flagellar biosynthetic protein FliR [Thermosinus carboxydivorans Nor1]|uniref:Flagellar biosynthetic protein FliR n=1 Tax=Thermosinus carboxydivorans Nor1 TaxID=401526 RepID=A1HN22_9FIRM|nr:flagellar biosynthetic protein FliR [Thermosinus carboxydivorans]EAX48650.1 flagellar biosynthetic protein FliR [Thermosinus carboxydivorans Nor1]